jgi:hypothetical protein
MAYGDGPADELLNTAWHRFCDTLKDSGDKAFKDSNPTGPLMRMDGYRFLTQNLGQAFPLALETKDPAYPMIHYFTHPLMKLGGDVSDFTYRQAWISGDYTYRITGKRGSARWFNVTVQGPKPDKIPGTDWPPLHEPFGDVPECNILGHQIKTDAEGNFELTIGGDERPENWLPTTPGSRKLFIREAFDSWDETPTPLTIEPVGMDAPRPMRSTGPEILSRGSCATGPNTAGQLRGASSIRKIPMNSRQTNPPTQPRMLSAGAWLPI